MDKFGREQTFTKQGSYRMTIIKLRSRCIPGLFEFIWIFSNSNSDNMDLEELMLFSKKDKVF